MPCRAHRASPRRHHYLLSLPQDCSASLELDNKRVKSLYRRAQAYEALDKLSEAFKDLKLAIHIDPKNKVTSVRSRDTPPRLPRTLSRPR